MTFLVFTVPKFSDAATKLVNDIIHTGNEAQLILRLPTVNDILNAQNAHQRILIFGHNEIETNTVSERMGAMAQSHDRAAFLAMIIAEIGAPIPPIAID